MEGDFHAGGATNIQGMSVYERIRFNFNKLKCHRKDQEGK
jgi:hypothetical protein